MTTKILLGTVAGVYVRTSKRSRTEVVQLEPASLEYDTYQVYELEKPEEGAEEFPNFEGVTFTASQSRVCFTDKTIGTGSQRVCREAYLEGIFALLI
jgi:hypothetical protein